MLKITKTEMQRISTSRYDHNEAEQYLKREVINTLNIIIYDGEYIVEASIEHYYHATVKFIISSNGKILFKKCHSNHWGNGADFMLAVLLLINQLQPTDFPFEYQSPRYKLYLEQQRKREEEELLRREKLKIAKSQDLINSYRGNIEQEIMQNISPDVCKISVALEGGGAILYLKLKVGSTTKYIVKNIQQFFRDIANENFVSYGKKLSFKHSEGHFDETSREAIALLRQILSIHDWSYHQGTAKELPLKPQVLDKFFTFYQQVPREYREFDLIDEPYLPILEIHESDDKYRLTLNDDRPLYAGQHHLYSFNGNTLSRIKLDENGKALKIFLELSKNREILVRKKDMSDFYRFVLSDIKDYFDLQDFKIDDIKEEESIVLYGDIDDSDRICLSLEYLYDNNQKEKGFNPQNRNLSLNAKKIEGYIKSYAEIDEKNHLAYMNPEDKRTQEFVQLGLPYLQQYGEVYVSEALRRIGSKSSISLNIGVTVQNNLLSIDLDSVNIPKDELAGVLDAYKRKKKFYKLKSGESLYLEADALEEVNEMLDTYNIARKDIEDGHLELDLYRAFSVNDFANKKNNAITFDRSKLFKDVIDRFSSINTSKYTLSADFQAILRDYQKYGYQWLQTIGNYGFGGILADDMGLGKTLQVITLLSEIKNKKQPHLVICPASLILNWQDEIHKFASNLNCVAIYGSVKKRKELINDYENYDVLITSYDYIRRDLDLYEKLTFDYIVLDEAQYIKNPKTKGAIAVKKLKGKHRLALTGTPIENSLAEIWSIFDFLMPGYLYNYGYFQKQFETPIVKEKNQQKQMELKKLISPFILRRTKKEVLTELPEKIEKTIPIEFSNEENKLYLANLAQVNKELQEKLEVDKSDRMVILAMLTRLRQICCEPRVIYENIQKPSSKIESCIDIIRTFKENGKKVLLFSSFTSVLDLISEELKSEKITYYTLTGKTDKDTRRQLVKQFQEDDTTVFLISLKAGGTGLNLTAAEAVIHFDPWWNVSAQNQATDRAHRFGQENIVQVYKLIMKNSIEEKILKLQEMKKDLSDTFVEGNDGTITSMSTEDLMKLFAI